jgi:protein-tyrosine phosphatase
VNHRSVLFVCTANLCRSPTAQGILRKMCAERGLGAWVHVDSAATHGHGAGGAPDPRSQAHAAQRGIDISDLRARQITDQDFERADLILVMDWRNLRDIEQLCPAAHFAKVRRITEFSLAASHSEVVPDPYRGDDADFVRVLDLLEDACEGLVHHLLALRP